MDSRRKVFLMPKEFVNSDNPSFGELEIITLKCPHTGNAVKYFLDSVKCQILEILQFSEDKSSWFIDNSVEEDGTLYISTPIDALFLALPYLKKSTMFSPFEQLFVDADFPDSKNLVQCCLKTIDLVTDTKDLGNSAVYRYNEKKTVDWLKRKVEKVTKTLDAKEIDCSSGAKSVTLVQRKREHEESNSSQLYAYGIVCEYVDEQLGQELSEALNIKDALQNARMEDKKSPAKKLKSGIIEPTENYFDQFNYDKKAKKPMKLSASQKKLMKVDKTGMKNISSFFGSRACKK